MPTIYSLIIYFCFTYLVDEKFLKLSWVKKNILTALMNDSQKAGLQSFFHEWNQWKNAQTNLSRQIFYLFICNEIIFFLECSKWAKARHLAQVFSHRVEKIYWKRSNNLEKNLINYFLISETTLNRRWQQNSRKTKENRWHYQRNLYKNHWSSLKWGKKWAYSISTHKR